jgi:hypothetical protein
MRRPRSGITTTSRARISYGMPRKRHSVRIIGGWTTGDRFAPCPPSPWRRRLRWIGAVTGSGLK